MSYELAQELRKNTTRGGNPPVVAEPVEAWLPCFYAFSFLNS